MPSSGAGPPASYASEGAPPGSFAASLRDKKRGKGLAGPESDAQGMPGMPSGLEEPDLGDELGLVDEPVAEEDPANHLVSPHEPKLPAAPTPAPANALPANIPPAQDLQSVENASDEGSGGF